MNAHHYVLLNISQHLHVVFILPLMPSASSEFHARKGAVSLGRDIY